MKKNDANFPSLLLKKGVIKEQFHLALKELILNGQLKSGTKLPSSRTLSEMMSISRNSVISGFDRLIDEGYLITKKGAGTYVSSIIPDEMIHIQTTAQHQRIDDKSIELNINPQMKLMSSIWDKS